MPAAGSGCEWGCGGMPASRRGPAALAGRRMPVSITPATTDRDVEDARALFRAYAASLDVDLCFQGFEAELAHLPGAYAPPRSALLLARDEAGAALGCVALRPLVGTVPVEGACEVKRLYVSAAAQGRGLGRALAEAALATARALGYREARLDTMPSMRTAIALYRALGFRETEPPAAAGGAPALRHFARALDR